MESKNQPLDWESFQITIEQFKTPTVDRKLPNGKLERLTLPTAVVEKMLLLLHKAGVFHERTDNVLSDV